MTIKYMTTSFLGDELLGVETMTVNQHNVLVSSPERAILECLNLPDASSSLLDIYYIMEGLTTLRPKLVQTLLEACTSQKVKRQIYAYSVYFTMELGSMVEEQQSSTRTA